MKIKTGGKKCTAGAVLLNIQTMKRLFAGFLALVLMLGLFVGTARAEERNVPSYYDPEDGELTHLELLEKLCTGFPYVGYEKYPEVPQYFQQDYADVRYGGWNGTVATHGCGITALAMLATYMTDTEMTPADLAEPFQPFSSDHGTDFSLFDRAPGMLGFYFKGRVFTWKEAYEALEQGYPVVSLQFADHFTTTAHFLVLCGLTDDGKVLIKDSNIFNHTKRFAGKDYYENGFEPKYVGTYGRVYWVYEKKLVRVPGCDRCAEPEVYTAPICGEPHYCCKCSALLDKQAAYQAAMAAVHVKPEI